MIFKAIRRKTTKAFICSGAAPALFKENYDFEEFLKFGMAGPPEDYEVVTMNVNVIEDSNEDLEQLLDEYTVNAREECSISSDAYIKRSNVDKIITEARWLTKEK